MSVRITDDYIALHECYRHAPHWEGTMLGPVPFASLERVRLEIQALFSASLDEAVEDTWAYARKACETYNYPFDSDEWDIVRLRLVNGN